MEDTVRVAERRKLKMYLYALLVLIFFALIAIIVTVKNEKKENQNKDTTIVSTTQAETTEAATEPQTTIEVPTGDVDGYHSNVIAIDAGHGGHSGCTYDGVYEDDINFAIAKKLEKQLQDVGFQTIMIREDEGPGWVVKKRAEIANEEKVGLYLSIHVNSEGNTSNGKYHGIETWYNSTKGDDTKRLAELVQKHVIAQTGSKDRKAVVENQFIVIKDTKMPSCLLEVGFLTNPEERKKMQTEDFQNQVAVGMKDAVLEYWGILPQ